MKKILFIWTVNETLKQYIETGVKNQSKKEYELIFLDPYSHEEGMKYVSEVDMIVGWRPTVELLKHAEKAILFHNPGVGVQHHIENFKALNNERKTPLLLTNGHGNTYFTAQHVVAMLLALTNKIISHHTWFQNGEWRKGDSDAKSIPLRAKNIGLLGYGSINQKVHKFLSGFDVSFSVLKRDWNRKRILDEDTFPLKPFKKYTLNELHQFLKTIDILIVAVPLTNQTDNLIGMRELKLLGKSAIIINVGRGSVVNEEALFTCLQSNFILGACIDVWYNYDPEPDTEGKKYPYENEHPFHKLDNVILSPHRGASPMDDLQRWNDAIHNMVAVINQTNDFVNLVNLELEY